LRTIQERVDQREGNPQEHLAVAFAGAALPQCRRLPKSFDNLPGLS
jgi:hypothetical protein